MGLGLGLTRSQGSLVCDLEGGDWSEGRFWGVWGKVVWVGMRRRAGQYACRGWVRGTT